MDRTASPESLRALAHGLTLQPCETVPTELGSPGDAPCFPGLPGGGHSPVVFQPSNLHTCPPRLPTCVSLSQNGLARPGAGGQWGLRPVVKTATAEPACSERSTATCTMPASPSARGRGTACRRVRSRGPRAEGKPTPHPAAGVFPSAEGTHRHFLYLWGWCQPCCTRGSQGTAPPAQGADAWQHPGKGGARARLASACTGPGPTTPWAGVSPDSASWVSAGPAPGAPLLWSRKLRRPPA